MAAVAITPTSGNITAVKTVCRITCSAVPSNTATGYSTAVYPQSPQITYTFQLSKAGSTTMFSPVLSTSAGQIAAWDTVIFPSAGTWTLNLKDNTGATTATASVTVA